MNNIVYRMRTLARIGRDQALNSQKDALVKFNETLSSKYKAALGLLYLEDYIGTSSMYQWMTEFIKSTNLNPVSASDFKSFIKSKTTKDIDWFFDDYLVNSKQVDYKITKVTTTKDSISFNVKNKKSGTTPISLFTLKDTLITSKIWLKDIGKEKRFSIPNNQEDQLILNFDQKCRNLILEIILNHYVRNLYLISLFRFDCLKMLKLQIIISSI